MASSSTAISTKEAKYEQFILALNYMLGQKLSGRANTQVELATAIKMNPVSLNAIIKRRVNSGTKREARAGEVAQKAIAHHYGMDLGEFLLLGARIKSGKQPANISFNVLKDKQAESGDRSNSVSAPIPDLLSGIIPLINDHARAYSKLESENYLLRSVLNHLPCGVVLVEPQTRKVLFQNMIHRQLTGTIMTGKPYCSGSDFCLACQTARLGVPQAETIFRKEGFNDFVEAIPLINSDGLVQSIMIIFVSGQNDSGLYEQVIREQVRLNLIIDSFKVVGITVFDENMNIKKVNNNYIALTGIQPEEIPTIDAARKVWEDLKTPEINGVISASKKAWIDRKPAKFNVTAMRTGYKLVFNLSPLLDDSGQFYGVSSICMHEALQNEIYNE